MNPRTLFLIRRLILMVSGEALQSGFHFALNLYLLHILSAADYGIFAISMVMGGVAIAYTRSLTAVPASVWISRSRTRAAANAYEVTFGSGALLLSAGLAVLAMLLLWLWQAHGPVVGGLFIGLWALRSHLRTASFARHRQWVVSCSDLTFTFVGCAITAFIVYQGHDVLIGIFEGLAIANGLGILLLLLLPRAGIRISFRWEVRRRYLRLWPQLRWTVFYVSTALLQGQTIAILVTSVAGPAAYAPIAAVMTLFAPLRIIATAFDNMMQPEMSAAMGRHDYARVWKQALVWSGLLGIGCLVYGALVFLIAPYIKSDTFANASIHVIGASAMVISTLLIMYSMPRIILETASAFSTLAMISGLAAIAGFVSIGALLSISTPAWALAGAALSEVVFFILCWTAIHRRLLADAGPATAGPAR